MTTQHRVPLKQLAARLLEVLNSTTSTCDALATLTGYSRDVVSLRLSRLEEAGCVRREKDVGKTGMRYIWHAIGVPLLDLEDEAAGATKRGGQLHQVTVKTYPAVHRRDPLVASLFGPASRESA